MSKMIISYEDFCNLVDRHLGSGRSFYIDLLRTIIDNPSRYCGFFRLSSAHTKIVQNVTQSREIKFGDILEELITEYIGKIGYINHDKNLGVNKDGDVLKVDQYFSDKNGNLYIVEMKVRDDHDSTKKRGQYSNFHKKIELVHSKHPSTHLTAIMWFVDDSLVKNRNYYEEEIKKEHFSNVDLNLYYGEDFLNTLEGGHEVWTELLSLLEEFQSDSSRTEVDIPDFGTSEEILEALVGLDSKHWNKLMSNNKQYISLRNLLFANGDNLDKAAAIRRGR